VEGVVKVVSEEGGGTPLELVGKCEALGMRQTIPAAGMELLLRKGGK